MKEIEKDVARRFLNLYNLRIGTSFEVIEVGETPDIRCIEKNNGKNLDLEITILQNLDEDARKEFERIKGERDSLGTSLGMRGNFEEILSNLKKVLDKKLKSNYEGTPTALVIGRVTSIWSCNDWQTLPGIKETVRGLIQGKEKRYPMGIWMFCTNENSSGDDILNLVEF